MFANAFQNKRVLVTGHTGFKGSWLTIWLLKLGAKVAGFSDRIPTDPSFFVDAGLEDKIEHYFGDVCNLEQIHSMIETFAPDFIFHLAAQAIVSVSYENPLQTVTTNVIGTANILESLRALNHSCTAVIVTSDKCYENVEWLWGYREIDSLGGRDVYSGSKGAAEVVFHSYHCSFFNNADSKIRVATGRAGNVIGGGDWSKDRIVADCMRNWSKGRSVLIRNPDATRPWQHVLEPLSGYLTLASAMAIDRSHSGESYNFGPVAEQNKTVLELLRDLSRFWRFDDLNSAFSVAPSKSFHEAGLLKLNCDKAAARLKWGANLNYNECVRFVSEWYFKVCADRSLAYSFTRDQIDEYVFLAKERGRSWAT